MNASNPNCTGIFESASNDQQQSYVVIARWTIFALNLLYYSLDCYVKWRQYRLYKQHKERPAEIAELVPADRYAKDRRNKLALLLFQMLYKFPFSLLFIIVILWSPFIFWLWKFAAESIGQQLLHTSNELVHVILYSLLAEFCIMPCNYLDEMFIKVVVARKWPTLEQLEERKTGMSPQPSLLTSTLDFLKEQFLMLCIGLPMGMAAFHYFILWVGPCHVALVLFLLTLLVFYASLFIHDFIVPPMLSIFLKLTPLTLHECALKRKMERMCSEQGVKLEGIFVSDDAHYVQLDGGWFSGWFSRAKLMIDERLLSKEFMEQVYSHNGLGLEKPEDLKKIKEEDDDEDEKKMEEKKKSKEPEMDEEEEENEEEKRREPLDYDEEHGLQTKMDKAMKKLPRRNVLMSVLRGGRRPGKVAPKLSLTRSSRENGGFDEDDDEQKFLELNDEELLGLLAAEIGGFKETYTLRNWVMRKNGFSNQLFTLFCLFHYTWREPWFFGVLHFPANYEQHPLLVSVSLCFTLLLTPWHKLYNGILEAEIFWCLTSAEVTSAIRLGRVRQFRAALLKIGRKCNYGMGDWLYCLLNPSERPVYLLKSLSEHVEKEEIAEKKREKILQRE